MAGAQAPLPVLCGCLLSSLPSLTYGPGAAAGVWSGAGLFSLLGTFLDF